MNPPLPSGRLVRINVNPQGGVPKHRVPSAELTPEGVSGDRQRETDIHGGPNQAVSLYSMERIQALVAEGHPIAPGTAGENLTVEGLDWERLARGDRLRIGKTLLEITDYIGPCKTIRASFANADFIRISQKLHPGWSRLYARVLQPGTVHEGDTVHHEACPTSGVAEG